MFGKGYIVDYCISLFQKEEEEKQYKEFYVKSISYIAQGVQFISHNTACIPAYFDVEAQALIEFGEYLEGKPKDERTTDEKIDDIMNLCGLGG